MMLYHGSHEIIARIDLSKCRSRTDFGKGFYLADKIGTAQAWAARKAELIGGTPTILRYEIGSDLYRLYGKRFENAPSFDWLDFISTNRHRNADNASKKEPVHDYNWVSGPIADDRIADVVDEYLTGDVSATEAIRRARILPQTYQLSIHTPDAIRAIDDENVGYKQFKNGRWTKDWRER